MKRLIATFQPQVWINDYAVDIDGASLVDVTDEVLALDNADIRRLENDTYESDNLVDAERLGHSGPFCVELEESLREFFGVDDQSEITDVMIEQARATQVLLPSLVKGESKTE